MLQSKVLEKIKTNIPCSVHFPRKLCVLLDNVEQYVTARPTVDNTIQRMRIACWIPKTTNTHSEYVILIVFPPRKRLRERPSVPRYTYSAGMV
jgi:hypothetical protein